MIITFGIMAIDNMEDTVKKVLEFNSNEFTVDRCCGKVYLDFLDYAFLHSDYFMLVYVNRVNKGNNSQMEYYKKVLAPYEIKCRTNPFWAGVWMYVSNVNDNQYEIVFYRNAPEAKNILGKVYKLSDWVAPTHPQDLAFYKGNQCWFLSIAEIKDGIFIHPTEEDFDFAESHGLAQRTDAFEAPTKEFYSAYDEVIEE